MFYNLKISFYNSRDWGKLDAAHTQSSQINWNPEYKFTKDDSVNAVPYRAFGSGSSYGLTVALDVDALEYFCSSTASVGFKVIKRKTILLYKKKFSISTDAITQSGRDATNS